jgi:hypothetical protein
VGAISVPYRVFGPSRSSVRAASSAVDGMAATCIRDIPWLGGVAARAGAVAWDRLRRADCPAPVRATAGIGTAGRHRSIRDVSRQVQPLLDTG